MQHKRQICYYAPEERERDAYKEMNVTQRWLQSSNR